MPLMYRLGCFRDDIIFLIYLYQKWIYPVDHKRVNEFGVSGEDIANAEASGTTAPLQIENQSDQNETLETKKDK